MSNFTPLSALAGGLLIGSSAAMLLLLNGRIAGISGIIGGIFRPSADDFGWRLAFLAGLVLAPTVYIMAGVQVPAVEIRASAGLMIIAGLLVGFGSRLGGGCTSGHGVCGIGRASPRSLAATGVFMGTAILTVFLGGHLAGLLS